MEENVTSDFLTKLFSNFNQVFGALKVVPIKLETIEAPRFKIVKDAD